MSEMHDHDLYPFTVLLRYYLEKSFVFIHQTCQA